MSVTEFPKKGGSGGLIAGFLVFGALFLMLASCVEEFDEAEFDRNHPGWDTKYEAERLRNMD